MRAIPLKRSNVHSPEGNRGGTALSSLNDYQEILNMSHGTKFMTSSANVSPLDKMKKNGS